MMMKALAAGLTLTALVGCAAPRGDAPSGIVPAEVWAQKITTTSDEFRKSRTIKGADADRGLSNVFIRRIESDGRPVAITQIYIAATYSGRWHFYTEARDISGEQLPVTLIDRDVDGCGRYSGCMFTEHVAVNVSDKYLADHVATGVDVRLYGKGGTQTFHVPGPYIEAFLAAIPARPAVK